MSEADPQIPVEPVDETETVVETEAPAPKRNKRRLLLMLSVPLLLLIAGGVYWLSLQGKVTTDNAYIQQDKVAVSAQVGGEIVEIFVGEGDTVNAGDLLFRIDPCRSHRPMPPSPGRRPMSLPCRIRPTCQVPTFPRRAKTSPSHSPISNGMMLSTNVVS